MHLKKELCQRLIIFVIYIVYGGHLYLSFLLLYIVYCLQIVKANKWKDVYENVNYAELINILGLGKYSGKYTDYESMKSFLFEEDNWSYFYNIQAETQESETEEAETENSDDSSNMQKSKSKYAVITIVPYCKSDLFEMLDINKDDICEDNMTYFERLDAMMMQARISIASWYDADYYGQCHCCHKWFG